MSADDNRIARLAATLKKTGLAANDEDAEAIARRMLVPNHPQNRNL